MEKYAVQSSINIEISKYNSYNELCITTIMG